MKRMISCMVAIFGGMLISSTTYAGPNADTVDGMHASDFAQATHSHAQSDVTGLGTALSGKADTTHSHAQSDVTGLGTALDGKANTAHDHDGVYQKKYAHVIVVATSSGDFDDVADAIASISGASESNPYLVKVMPGVYDLGSTGIVLPPYVSLQGAGVGVTVLTGDAGTLVSVSTGNVESLTIAGGSGRALDMTEYGSARIANLAIQPLVGAEIGAHGGQNAFTMRNVSIIADGDDGQMIGLNVENNTDLDIDIDNVTIQVTGNSGSKGMLAVYGSYNIIFRNGKINAVCQPSGCTGVHMNGGTIRNSEVHGDYIGVQNGDTVIVGSKLSGGYSLYAGDTSRVAFSELDGAILGSGIDCFSVHDANYAAVTCP